MLCTTLSSRRRMVESDQRSFSLPGTCFFYFPWSINNGWATWRYPCYRSPDDAKIKNKMVYSSSKDALRRALDGLQVEIQGTDYDEVSEETSSCSPFSSIIASADIDEPSNSNAQGPEERMNNFYRYRISWTWRCFQFVLDLRLSGAS